MLFQFFLPTSLLPPNLSHVEILKSCLTACPFRSTHLLSGLPIIQPSNFLSLDSTSAINNNASLSLLNSTQSSPPSKKSHSTLQADSAILRQLLVSAVNLWPGLTLSLYLNQLIIRKLMAFVSEKNLEQRFSNCYCSLESLVEFLKTRCLGTFKTVLIKSEHWSLGPQPSVVLIIPLVTLMSSQP